MKSALNATIGAILALLAMLGSAPAQTAGPEARLKELNITLPYISAPFTYQTYQKYWFLKGNTPGAEWPDKGKVGKDLTVEQGYQAARQTGIIALAKLKQALRGLDRVKRIVKVDGRVNSASGGNPSRVVDGFSDLMVAVFGEAIGKHERSAVGVAGLPDNAAVEVELIVEVE